MASDSPQVQTELYAIEVHEAESGELYHVLRHPIRAPSPATAVWQALQVYRFHIRHWRLQAVPAAQHFPQTEAAA